jgi:hypothetical protein
VLRAAGGAPLEAFSVRLTPRTVLSSSPSVYPFASADGSFRLDLPTAGSVDIEVHASGFAGVRREGLKLAGGETLQLVFELPAR